MAGEHLAVGEEQHPGQDTATAEALQAIVDLDLADLAGIEPLRSYEGD